MAQGRNPVRRVLMAGVALAALAACEGFDSDMRDIGDGFDTTRAVQDLPGRPRPDDRGVISYPNYQVVVANPRIPTRSIILNGSMCSIIENTR